MSTISPSRGWVSATEAIVSDRAPRPAEVETIDRVHDLCREWQKGLPVNDVRQLCTGMERWTAVRFTPRQHIMFRPLHMMLDALIRTDVTDKNGMQYQTRYGTFSELELRHVRARITRPPDGLIQILFPIQYPWRRRPDTESNDAGDLGEPLYAEGHDERMEMAIREYRVNKTTGSTSTRRHVFD